MGAEELIINDIIDSVYGFDITLEEKDSQRIKVKEKERQKKYDDTLLQINNLCKKIEKELGKAIDTSTPEIGTFIRLTVLTSIRAEISNGNKVLDANGKIDVGKFLDIVIQSKDEILGKVETDIDKAEGTSFESFNPETNQGTNEKYVLTPDEERELDEFIGGAEDFGIDFDDREREALRRARFKVNEFNKKVQEKIESGIPEDEAIRAIYDNMTPLEREELDWQFALANIQDGFSLHRKEKKDDKEKEDMPSKTENLQEAPEVTVGTTFEQEDCQIRTSKQQKENYYNYGIQYHTIHMESCGEQELQNKSFTDIDGLSSDISDLLDIQSVALKLVGNKAFMASAGIQSKDNFIWYDQIESVGKNFGRIMNPLETMSIEGVKMLNSDAERFTAVLPETVAETDVLKKEELSSIARTITEQAERYKTSLHEMIHATTEKGTDGEDITGKGKRPITGRKISNTEMKSYFFERSELLTISSPRENMYTDISMLGESSGRNGLPEVEDDKGVPEEVTTITPASAPEPLAESISIVEEMTVDGGAITQGESSQPDKKGILSASDIIKLVENQAEVRKMLEANGIIHGQMLEGPTTGKTETQGTPEVDNDERSGEEPEEH